MRENSFPATASSGDGGGKSPLCPVCGGPLQAEASGGGCLVCLLQLGLSEKTVGEAGNAGGTAVASTTSATTRHQPDPVYQHYRVLQREDGSLWELGRGAMGVTYKAIDTNLHSPVVLKVIGSQALHHPGARERFLHEARAAARLRHPNVASVFHLGQRGDDCFYAMEFIEGETVQDLVRRQGPIPVLEALAIAEQVARALAAAHREHLVHRDIKPTNLMLVRELEGRHAFVKVIDFGIVKYLAATGGDTQAFAAADLTGGGLVGTPSYASPEQLTSGEDAIDGRADFYSLGCTLWFMLLGTPPFTGDAFRVIGQHLNKQPPFAELTAAQMPASVVALLRSLLKKEPADRPRHAAELRARLELCMSAVQAAGSPTVVPAGAGQPAVDQPEPEDAAEATRVSATTATPVPPLVPRGTVRMRTMALLLTNIESSTAYWERDGASFRDVLERHHELLRAEFDRHGGEEINEVGDGFLVAFDEAAAALNCALAVQHLLGAAELWPRQLAANPLRLRMALHVGTIERHGEAYRSLDLHRSTRILRVARGGQIVCSAAAAALLRDGLPAGCQLSDLGEHRLGEHDAAHAPERLFLVHYPGMGGTDLRATLLPTAPGPPGFGLPATLTRFFGRESEIATLCGWLGAPLVDGSSATGAIAEGQKRLVTLTGPGGTGKTRLALAVAERIAAAGAQSICFLPLVEVTDAGLLADRLRAVLLRPASGEPPSAPTQDRSALEQSIALLAPRPTLLILDNFEHLAGDVAAAFVSTLLERLPRLRCLITSRQRLDLSGEWEFAVAPLPAPPADGSASVTQLGEYASVQLFCDRALAARADFRLTPAIAPTVADLCRRLDGIPLAIELAAARVQLLTPRQIVTRLTHCLDVLVGGKKDAAARHRTLRATLDWSHDLLPPELRAFFARLSVFRGGWTAEASAAIALDTGSDAAGKPPEPDAALEPLGELRKCSLILADEGADETMRFRMLEPLRQYAEERLERAGAPEAAATRKRHQDYFVLLALRAEPELRKPDQGHWLKLLEAEHENFRAVLAAAPEGDAVRLPLALALHRFWMLHGYVSEGRGWLQRALDEDAARGTPTDPTRARARNAAGVLAWSAGNLEAARGHFGLALAHFRLLDDVPGSARALNNLAIVASEQGDFDAARQRYEESFAVWREVGNVGEQALVLSNLGRVLLLQGETVPARARLEESLALQRASQDPFSLLNTLATLGEVEAKEENFQAAYRHFEQSVRIREEIGYKNNANLFWTLASLASRRGEPAEACRFLAAAEACRKELGLELTESEQTRWETDVAACAGDLPFEKYSASWDAGKTMKLGQILRLIAQHQE